MNQWKLKITILLIFSLSLSCSRMDIALSLADRFFVSELDDYFDLTSDQKRNTKLDFNKTLDEIRKDLFPEIAAQLDQMAVRVENNTLNEDQFSETFNWSIQLFRRLSVYFEKPSIQFFNSLTEKQIEYFAKASEEKRQTDSKKYDSTEKIQHEDLEKIDKWISMTIEDLSKDQTSQLKEFVRQNPYPYISQLDNQRKLTQLWVTQLKSKSDLTTLMTDWTHERDKFDTKEYLSLKKSYQANLKKFIFDLYKNIDSNQRKTFAKNLRKRAKDFREHALK